MYDDLRKWNDDLRYEIDTLKRKLKEITGDDSDDHKWHMLGLTKSEERVLRVLLIREFAPYEALLAALYWDRDEPECAFENVKVFMTRLRIKLPFLKPWLKNVESRGYSLLPEGKHRLLFELKNPGVARAVNY